MRYSLAIVILIAGLLWAGSSLAEPEVYSPAPAYPGRYTAEEQANLNAAQACLDAFVAGDMDGFYSFLDDDIVWEANGSPDFVASHGSWYGIDAVRDWVAQVDEELEFLDFTAEQWWADGDTVLVLCHEVDRAKATDKTIDEREIGIFTFDNGKVVHFQIFDDSAQEHWAMTPDA